VKPKRSTKTTRWFWQPLPSLRCKSKGARVAAPSGEVRFFRFSGGGAGDRQRTGRARGRLAVDFWPAVCLMEGFEVALEWEQNRPCRRNDSL